MPIPRDHWAPRRLEDIVGGISIWVLSPAERTSGSGRSCCADPGYVKMRIDPITLLGLPPAQADAVKRVCQEHSVQQ